MLTIRTTPIRTTPIRTAPIRTSPFDRSVDRAFDQLVGSFFESRRAAGPVVDASWQGGTYVLTVDLPGVPATAVDVSVAGTTLTLTVATDSLEWQRSVRLGGRLDPDKVEASHVDGRLTVRIGTVDAPTARKVEIGTAPLPALESAGEPAASAAIDASSTDTATEPDHGQSSDTNSAG
jgi:HSP20 family protein